LLGCLWGLDSWAPKPIPAPKPALPFITLGITPSIFPVSTPSHSSLSILPLHPYQTFTDAASHLHIFDNPCGEEHLWPTQEEIDSKPKTGNEEVRSVEIVNHSQTTIETAKAVFRVSYNDSFGGGCMPSSSPSAYQEDVVSIPPLDPGKGFQFFAVNQTNRCAWLLPPTTIKVKIVGDEAEKEVPLTLEPSNIPNWTLTPFPPTDIKWQGVPIRNPGYGIVRSAARCKLPDVPIETPEKSALEPPIKVVSHPYDLSANRRKKLLALLKPDEADYDALRIGCMASSDSSCVAAGNFIVLFSEAGWKIDSDRVFRAEPTIPKDGVSLVTHLDKELPKQPPHLGTWQLMSPSQVKISKALTKMGIPTSGSGQLDMPVGTLGVYFGPEPGPQTIELQLLLSNCEPSSESCDILPVSTDTHGSFLTNGNVRQLVHAKRPKKVLTAVRLKVEENQLVGVFGEIGVRVDGLKSA
jgi:hypothetical protein